MATGEEDYKYPVAIDKFTTKEDRNFEEQIPGDDIIAKYVNDVQARLVKTQEVIGINPQGNKESLNKRISVSIDADGNLKGGVNKYLMCGLKCSSNPTNPTYQIDVGEGECGSDDGTTYLSLTSPKTVDINQSGVNGLDTGSKTANTWYFIWLIFNPTTEIYAGLFSLSSTTPTLPTDYTKKRRIGSVRNNGTSNFYTFRHYGNNSTKKHVYLEASSSFRFTLDGSTITWTTLDLSSAIPPTSQLGYFRLTTLEKSSGTFTIGTDGFDVAMRQIEVGNYGKDSYMAVFNQILRWRKTAVGSGKDGLIDVYFYQEEL